MPRWIFAWAGATGSQIKFPDGRVLWINGEFEIVERPHRLVYTWRVGDVAVAAERVTVTFEARGEATEVIVAHERIPTESMRDMHEQGWVGCLDGLVDYLQKAKWWPSG
jgi:uncharacterized protein YndB with AHSA1/START domain